MNDTDWMLWNHEPPRLASERGQRERLFAMVRSADHACLESELRYHGEFGVEAQFDLKGDLLIGRTFPTKAMAVQWAEHERAHHRREGWADAAPREVSQLPDPRK